MLKNSRKHIWCTGTACRFDENRPSNVIRQQQATCRSRYSAVRSATPHLEQRESTFTLPYWSLYFTLTILPTILSHCLKKKYEQLKNVQHMVLVSFEPWTSFNMLIVRTKWFFFIYFFYIPLTSFKVSCPTSLWIIIIGATKLHFFYSNAEVWWLN